MSALSVLVSVVSAFSALFMLEVLRSTIWQPKWDLRGVGYKSSARLVVVRLSVAVALGVGLAIWWGDVYASMATSAALWLMMTSVETDLIGRKIPREPCWTVLLIGVLGGLASLSAAGGISFILAFVCIGIAMLLAALVTKGGLGSGDVRFFVAMTPLAWWIGTSLVLVAVLIACIIQVAARVFLLAVGRPRYQLPFGPALSLGMLAALLAYPRIGGGACLEWAGMLPCG